jgi:hypothetical protein
MILIAHRVIDNATNDRQGDTMVEREPSRHTIDSGGIFYLTPVSLFVGLTTGKAFQDTNV